MNIQRGEIYFVCFDPVFGREIGGFKSRPALVLSINRINTKTRLITVIPGTTAKPNEKTFNNIVQIIPDEKNGLLNTTNFQCHQIRAIEMGRITQKAKGKVSSTILKQIENAVKFSLGFAN